MRSIARQSVRLANQSHVKQVLDQQGRSFRTSASHSDHRDPNSPPNNSPPRVERRFDESKAHEHGSGKPDREGEAVEPTITEEGRKPALRKTLRRQRNGQDRETIPAPPPIPDWFLKHNVSLNVDAPKHDSSETRTIRCIDKETGHTVFQLPYFEAQPLDDRPDLDKSLKLLQDKYARLVADAQQSLPEWTGVGEEPKKDKKSATLEENFFDNKYVKSAPQTAAAAADAKASSSKDSRISEEYEESGPNVLFRWVLLEIEASLQAGFTAATQARQSSSHAASRVDISLQCPDSDSHDQMDTLMDDLAAVTRSNLVRLDANDFADLTAEYVGQGSDIPGSFSTLAHDVFDGYTANSPPGSRSPTAEENEEDDQDEDEEPDEESNKGFGKEGFVTGSISDLRKALFERRQDLGKALGAISVTGITIGMPGSARGSNGMMQPSHSNNIQQWDEARLTALLDNILDAPKLKKGSQLQPKDLLLKSRLTKRIDRTEESTSDRLNTWRMTSSHRSWESRIANTLALYLGRPSKYQTVKLEPATDSLSNDAESPKKPAARTIVHIRDLKDICNSKMGEIIVQRLTRVVQKRRRSGEEIVIVGTTAQDDHNAFMTVPQDDTGLPFKTLTVPPLFELDDIAADSLRFTASTRVRPTGKSYRRIAEINLRNIQSMLHRLRPADEVNLSSKGAIKDLMHFDSLEIGRQIYTLGRVHRIVLTAIGLSQIHATSEIVRPIHVSMGVLVTSKADWTVQSWHEWKERTDARERNMAAAGRERVAEGRRDDNVQARMDHIKKKCNAHETRLLTGVVDPQNIKTGFNGVHAPPETIEALKTLTSLSLLRPDAFKYGVLAQDRLPGLMLYGPPGTGKTLLARAVAKESGATVLEVSGAQIYEKYVGEGEKMVRAVFSLAKKLSPCIVFIDEADAIFGSRSNAGNRNTHREIINQFLREWDGMDLHNVFIMVASNRPFDLDDAVLRRLPRRLLVDLPVAKDRESILKIHLKDEMLDGSVSLAALAEQTPLYSGSDLKNLCVAAALACVREEIDVAQEKEKVKEKELGLKMKGVKELEKQRENEPEKGQEKEKEDEEDETEEWQKKLWDKKEAEKNASGFPEKRILSSLHFEKAIREISASISEDMSSLTAIRKFDEQYGDRRGRRKKADYGFGMGDAVVDESSVRVRPGSTP